MHISDKTVLVTGANGGIGREFVKGLLERGAVRVYGADVNTGHLRAFDDDRVSPLELDVTNDDQIATAIDRTLAETGAA